MGSAPRCGLGKGAMARQRRERARATRARATRRFGSGEPVEVLGLEPRPLQDVYHFLVTSSWPRLLGLVIGAFFAVNALFAVGYLALGDGIENAQPGSFSDAFFFAVQTMATVGYGKLAPKTFGAEVLSTLQIATGLIGLALVTGLVFSKFSRPTARVLFSQVAVVSPFEGVPSLMFRMANARASQIVEAHVTVTLVRLERTREGEEFRRIHDLHLRRDHSALFALSWTAIHPIGPESPLHGVDAAGLAATEAGVIVSFSGYDEEEGQTVHARHGYRSDQIVFGRKLANIILRDETGRPVIDYRRFHDLEPVETPAVAADGGKPREAGS
jgi:inward rectifier potassium channel